MPILDRAGDGRPAMILGALLCLQVSCSMASVSDATPGAAREGETSERASAQVVRMEPDEVAGTMVCRGGNREQLRLASSGSGSWSGPDVVQVSFHLQMVAALAGGFCGFTDGGVLILWESAGAVDGASGVAFVDSARRGVAWQRMYGMVNVGHPLIAGGVLYFTAMALVGAVRVNDGTPIWSRGGLWRPGLYGGFGVPEVRGNTVRFKDRHGDATLVVEMATGRILEGAPPEWAPGDGMPDPR